MKLNALLLGAALAANCWLVVPANAQTTSAAIPAATPLAPTELLERLRAGGYTIHFRHALTDHNRPDIAAAITSPACVELGDCGDCSQQRNLSEAGREQARKIGLAIRALNIPIGAVLASPLCRTMDTARLMFGRVRAEPDVRGGGPGRSSYPGLLRLLSTPVSAGANQFLSGHASQFNTLAGVDFHLDEGDAAVIRGLDGGKFEIIALVSSDEWERLR